MQIKQDPQGAEPVFRLGWLNDTDSAPPTIWIPPSSTGKAMRLVSVIRAVLLLKPDALAQYRSAVDAVASEATTHDWTPITDKVIGEALGKGRLSDDSVLEMGKYYDDPKRYNKAFSSCMNPPKGPKTADKARARLLRLGDDMIQSAKPLPGINEISRKYLPNAADAVQIMTIMATYEALGIDPLSIWSFYTNLHTPQSALYGARSSRWIRRERPELKDQLRKNGWQPIRDATILERGQAWVEARIDSDTLRNFVLRKYRGLTFEDVRPVAGVSCPDEQQDCDGCPKIRSCPLNQFVPLSHVSNWCRWLKPFDEATGYQRRSSRKRPAQS